MNCSITIQKILLRSPFCFLAWCALVAAPTCAQTITHVPLFTFHGDSDNDQLGFEVSGTGDVNGDGFADLIAGAPFDDDNGSRSGTARVISGIDGSVLYDFRGDIIDEIFGWSVSGAGDVNGDGFADLIVGAPTFGNGILPNGSARVLSGIDGSVLYTLGVNSPTDFFARAVSGAGDVNGDGFADLIVGVPMADSAQVFSGIDGSVLYTLADPGGELFGRRVSDAGDVNLDGFADLIVGDPRNDRVRVFSGIDGSVLYTFDGDTAGDQFGGSVSGAGDVNGDGYADLIVGANADDNNGNASGSARVFSGVDGSVLYTFDGDFSTDLVPSFGDSFGSAVSGAGDLNGDGFADLIVGAPNDDPNGQNSGSVRVFSGFDGSVLYNFDGDSFTDFLNGDRFGTSVSGTGDVNGDGVPDFVVGALDGGANGGGYVRLFVSQITGGILLGDCNQDGVVTFADIPAFVEVVASGGFLAEADCNEDTVADLDDIPFFIAILIAN